MKKEFWICASRFNKLIVERLVSGAQQKLIALGVDAEKIKIQWVPGAMELPLAVQWVIRQNHPAGVIAVGAVIRGGTSHFDYVCQGTTSGLMNVMLTESVPVGFGVLTCDDLNQAFDRADGKHGNKGAEAAEAVYEMSLKRNQVTQRKPSTKSLSH